MKKMKMLTGGVVLLLGLMLTCCAGYYSGYGYGDNPYYEDYGSGYFAYPYYHNHHESGEHHREFGQSPQWHEHQERGDHHEGGEHREGGEHHH